MSEALHFLPLAPDASLLYMGAFSPAWVAISVLLAILGSYAALRASARVGQLHRPASKLAWVAISAMTMGLSVWAMHFIGMLAFSLPYRVNYDPLITLLSTIPGILAGAIAAGVGWQNMRQLSSLSSSLLLGAGIGLMHYTGMAAMQIEGSLRYDPYLVTLSILVVVVLSYVALRIRSGAVELKKGQDVLVAVVMGGAISGMHYTAMSATYFVPGEAGALPPSALTTDALAMVIAATTIFLAVGALALAALSRSHALIAQLRESEGRNRQLLTENETILSKLMVGIAYIKDQRIVSCNRRLEEIFQYEPGELLGASPDRLLESPEALSQVEQITYKTAAPSSEQATDVRMKRKDGSLFWGSVTGAAVDPSRPHDGSIWSYSDITERKQTAQELDRYRRELEQRVVERTAELDASNRSLRISEQRLSAMLSMSLAAPKLDEDEILRDGIEEAVRLTGSEIGYIHLMQHDQETYTLHTWSKQALKECEIPGARHFPVKHAGVWADTVRLLRPVVHNDYQNLPGRKGYPAPHPHLVRHLGAPIMDGDRVGLLVGVGNKASDYDDSDVATLQLIGNHLWSVMTRRRADVALLQAKSAAEVASVAKGAFLANMSHEIRTPLAAILGFSTLLRDNPDASEKQRTALGIINQSGQHLLELINEVLDMAKIDAGNMHLEMKTIALDETLHQVTTLMQLRAEHKHLQLTLAPSPKLPRFIHADGLKLRQILINLLGNAIKFTAQGGVVLRVKSVPGEAAQELLVLEVEDTGIGIKADDQDRIFEPFVQIDRKFQSGTGLGLAITRSFVRLMGGRIYCHSTFGKGSLFRVELPVDCAEMPEQSDNQTTSGRVLGLAPGQADYRILIVEDQIENSELLAELMDLPGLHVTVERDGQKGVDRFMAWQPHLIWMDLRMPVLDGVAATRQIRAMPGGQDVKIVAVTASVMEDAHSDILAAGFDGIIRKPYRFNEIYDALSQLLGIQFVRETVGTNAKP